MPIYLYLIPVIVIGVIFIVVIPMMKKKSKKLAKNMSAIQDLPVHLFMLAGPITSINEKPEDSFVKSNFIYGLDFSGSLDIEFIPKFTYANTEYTGVEPMHIQFNAESGKSYEIRVSPNRPKDDLMILDISPIVDQKLLFKTTFYIITKDITDTKDAKAMRGIY